MVVRTRSERVDHSRRMVLEFLGSSVDLSLTPNIAEWNATYGAEPDRYGESAATVAQPVKIDNELYVRDYSKCILCYQCVDACGEQWQNSFVIDIAGRGFDAHVSTENDVALPDSACVYCGNCIQVCPTGALLPTTEFDMRAAGTWDPDRQTETETICGFCGVGCALTLHVQDETIVKVTSPPDNAITHGNLCIKGRFGFQHAQNLPDPE
jgi:predicted molibdopterin-dependent oxidoreductase YjgC